PTLQSSFFYSTLPPPPRSPLFPYTTLFRSRGPATASSSPSGRPRIDLSCSASSGSLDSARAAEPAHVGDQLTDLYLRQGGAEGGHARPSDGRAAVLDDVDERLVGALIEATGVGEIAGTDQEERGAPGTAPVHAVARDAERVEEPLAARGAAGWPRRVEERREARCEDADRRDREDEDDQRAAHGPRG